jgi:hypothetical protein
MNQPNQDPGDSMEANNLAVGGLVLQQAKAGRRSQWEGCLLVMTGFCQSSIVQLPR